MAVTEEATKAVAEIARSAPVDRLLVLACLGLIGFSSFYFLPAQMERYDAKATAREDEYIKNNAAQRAEHLASSDRQRKDHMETMTIQREFVAQSLASLEAAHHRDYELLKSAVDSLIKTIEGKR